MCRGLWRAVVQQLLSYAAVQAIRANEHVALILLATNRGGGDAFAVLFIAINRRIQMRVHATLCGYSPRQQRVQISTMYGGIRRTVASQRGIAQTQCAQGFAGDRITRLQAIWVSGYRFKRPLQAPAVQDACDVGAELDARADLSKCGRAFQ